MKTWHLLLCTALASTTSGHAFAADAEQKPEATQPADRAQPTPAKPAKAFSTGVAKGRDLLDTAISASTIDELDLPKLGTSSIAGISGNLPGIRAETSGIDGFSSLTVRGLPLSDDGSKYMQIQEDGLPIVEFGDIKFGLPDAFMRADIGLSQVQAIRGGSASTFASNSPGGVINFISKTGEVEGGAVQVAAGLDHDLKRVDFSYGAPLGEGWRLHVGGFYREGEGPRAVGYTAFRGGQVKLNVTRQFANGYIRVYGKYLDDHQPNYSLYPILISGTNAAPTFTNVPGVDILKDGMQSQYTSSYTGLDDRNQPTTIDGRRGVHSLVRSIGAEAQFDFGGWTITDKFRFSSIGGEYNEIPAFLTAPAVALATMIGGPGAVVSYAGGPSAGQTITDLSTVGGNGFLNLALKVHNKTNSLDNITNDLRTSKVWTLGGGKLTTSAGLYTSRQTIDLYNDFATSVETLSGGGTSVPINIATAGGFPITDGGILAYGFAAGPPPASYHAHYNVRISVLAPYGSINYQIGKLAVGGSLRFDRGSVTGPLLLADGGIGLPGTATIDVNGDGRISFPEANAAVLPLSQPTKADYDYRYTSYSVGVNYRLAEPLSVFARYSRGGRASAERKLFGAELNQATGQLVDPSSAYSPVKQAEGGFKLRQKGVTLFVTGFWASTNEKTLQVGANALGELAIINVDRTYSAKGVELEADLRHGPFSVAMGATYAKAKIDKDTNNPAVIGNKPRHQPSLFFNVRPQFEQGMVTIGATINGTTNSFAQDTNILRQSGYTIVSPFVFIRPLPRVQVGLNAFNVFDKLAFVNIGAGAIPASGIVSAQVLNGRTITGSIRYSF